ncbi:MAG TPA: acyl-CoA dehydrogenase family protein [Acidimicrobiales bacterium]|nr:acyl-CoA dehydrogenase family protein [Acidimicrobiales bacterium]
MDFGFTEDQESLRALAVKVLDGHAGDDRALWDQLAATGLIGAALAPPCGDGMGLMGLCIIAEQLGRRALLQPLGASVAAALCLEQLAPALDIDGLARGSTIATIALEEPAGYDPLDPATTLSGQGRLAGQKTAVPWAPRADLFLVSARDATASAVLVLVGRDDPGLTIEESTGTAGEPLGRISFNDVDVPTDRIFTDKAVTLAHDTLLAVECATAAGVLDGGLRITSQYIAGREQFGRPIAAFQGPALRIADAYIDTQAVWAATWSAIWRLATGRPAGEALAIAKFWVADGGQRAVHAFQHLHGGMGVDTSYPIHRYFALAKALEVRLGGAPVQLERLGAALAAES